MKVRRWRIVGLLVVLVVMVALGLLLLQLSGPAIGNIQSNILYSFESGSGQESGAGRFSAGKPTDGLFQMVSQEEAEEFDLEDGDRVILRSATLTLTVEDVPAKLASVQTLAEEFGGWVVSSSTSQFTAFNGEVQSRANVTIRVPAARLDEALAQIKTGVGRVDNENITGQDVTQQYVDSASRLKNLEAAETQMQALMEDAADVQDVLAIYTELVTLRGEIESLRGQLQYFQQSAAFSSVTVNLNPPAPSPVTSQTAGWNPGTTVERAFGALLGVLRFAVDAAIMLAIVVLPIVVVIGLPAWVILRRRRASAPEL